MELIGKITGKRRNESVKEQEGELIVETKGKGIDKKKRKRRRS